MLATVALVRGAPPVEEARPKSDVAPANPTPSDPVKRETNELRQRHG
jgi:hypothetical protein